MANQEHFWGLPVPVNASPVSVDLEGKCLHITQIALPPGSPSPVALSVSTALLGKKRQFVLATLSKKSPQATVDATFFEYDKKVTFYAQGASGASLHLTGAMISEAQGEDSWEEKRAAASAPQKAQSTNTAALLDEDEDDEEDEDFEPNDAGNDDEEDDEEDDDDEEDEEDEDEDEDEDDEDEEDDDEDDEEDEEEDEEEPEPVKKEKRKASRPAQEKAEKKRRKQVKQEAPATTPKKKAKKTKYHLTKSGLKMAVLKQGAGAKLTPGAKVKIHYTGKLHDSGKVFDSSQGGQPLAFRCGLKKVIKGFDEGVLGMKKGEVRKLVIPPNLAYGTKGAGGVVPPNATLEFEISRV